MMKTGGSFVISLCAAIKCAITPHARAVDENTLLEGTVRIRPRIAVSACLLGRKVRYDGDHKRQDWLAAALEEVAEIEPA